MIDATTDSPPKIRGRHHKQLHLDPNLKVLNLVLNLMAHFPLLLAESSLKHSKTQSLKQLLVADNVDIQEAVNNILRIKSVSPEVHPQ